MLQYFITFFKGKISQVDASQNDLKLVIKAFGAFAGPCHIYMKQEDVICIFNEVVQRGEKIYFRSAYSKI